MSSPVEIAQGSSIEKLVTESKVCEVPDPNLYLSDQSADVYFVFNTGERIPAHKSYLASSSDVFNAMFFGSIKEKGDVFIVDASVSIFKEFLKFFYYQKIELTEETVTEIVCLANKYNVIDCLKICDDFYQKHLTVENVFEIYEVAIHLNQMNLIKICEYEISEKSEKMFLSKGFLECTEEMLEKILKLKDLQCTESVVFKACMEWIKSSSKSYKLTRYHIENYFGRLFYLICFKSMTIDEFIDLLPEYGHLFLPEEYCEILQMLHRKEYKTVLFTEKRNTRFQWNKNKMVKCERLVSLLESPHKINNIETTIFTVNKPMILGDFTCSPIYKFFDGNSYLLKEKVLSNITIVRIDEGIIEHKLLYSMQTTLKSSFTNIKLSKPIFIKPHTKHEIRIHFQTTEEFFVYAKLINVMQLIPNIIIHFYKDYNFARNTPSNTVAELTFNLI